MSLPALPEGFPPCQTCGILVTGYTWVMQFSFVDGYRQPGIEECHLSCGCTLVMPAVAITGDGQDSALVTIKDFTMADVLTFSDKFEEVEHE